MPRATDLVRCRLCGAMAFDTELEGRYCLVCVGRVRNKPSDRARKRQRQRARQRQDAPNSNTATPSPASA
jgi:hypothetical protein